MQFSSLSLLPTGRVWGQAFQNLALLLLTDLPYVFFVLVGLGHLSRKLPSLTLTVSLLTFSQPEIYFSSPCIQLYSVYKAQIHSHLIHEIHPKPSHTTPSFAAPPTPFVGHYLLLIAHVKLHDARILNSFSFQT